MYGTSLRLGRRTLLTSAAAVVALPNSEREKLSIYPSPPAEIVLIETPSELERQIGVGRKALTQSYNDAHAQVQGLVSRWIGVEHAIESRVKSIISPEESLTPGILYVGIATLSASILARNRMLLTRFILPPTFLLVSMNHFLPKTTANLSEYLGSLEDTYFPTLAQKHSVANAHTQMTLDMIKNATANGKDKVYAGVEVGLDKLQDATGLKLKESIGWRNSVTAAVQAKVSEVKVEAEKKVEELKIKVEDPTRRA